MPRNMTRSQNRFIPLCPEGPCPSYPGTSHHFLDGFIGQAPQPPPGVWRALPGQPAIAEEESETSGTGCLSYIGMMYKALEGVSAHSRCRASAASYWHCRHPRMGAWKEEREGIQQGGPAVGSIVPWHACESAWPKGWRKRHSEARPPSYPLQQSHPKHYVWTEGQASAPP